MAADSPELMVGNSSQLSGTPSIKLPRNLTESVRYLSTN